MDDRYTNRSLRQVGCDSAKRRLPRLPPYLLAPEAEVLVVETPLVIFNLLRMSPTFKTEWVSGAR